MNAPTLHLWRLDDGVEHVIAAADEETALRAGLHTYAIGEDVWPGDDPVSVEQIPDDQEFTVAYPDGLEPPYPEGARIEEDTNRVHAPARAWAVLCGNGVLVGSEEY